MVLHPLSLLFLLTSLCNSGTILVSSNPNNEQAGHVETVSQELNSTLTGRLESKTFGLIRDLLFGPTTTTTKTTTTTTTTASPAVIVTSDSCRCGIKTGNRILGGLDAEVCFQILFPYEMHFFGGTEPCNISYLPYMPCFRNKPKHRHCNPI